MKKNTKKNKTNTRKQVSVRSPNPLGTIFTPRFRPITVPIPWFPMTLTFEQTITADAKWLQLTPQILHDEFINQLHFFEDVTGYLGIRVKSFTSNVSTNHNVTFRTYAIDSRKGTDFLRQWEVTPRNEFTPARTGYTWPPDSQNEIVQSDEGQSILMIKLSTPAFGVELKGTINVRVHIDWSILKEDNEQYEVTPLRNSLPAK